MTNKKRIFGIKKRTQYINRIFSVYKNAAPKRGYRWKLSLKDFLLLVNSPCYYCGDYTKNEYCVNGVDRLDNNLGYIPTNVVSCCNFCNIAKSKYSVEFFVNKIEQIYNNLNLGEPKTLLRLLSKAA